MTVVTLPQPGRRATVAAVAKHPPNFPLSSISKVYLSESVAGSSPSDRDTSQWNRCDTVLHLHDADLTSATHDHGDTACS